MARTKNTYRKQQNAEAPSTPDNEKKKKKERKKTKTRKRRKGSRDEIRVSEVDTPHENVTFSVVEAEIAGTGLGGKKFQSTTAPLRGRNPKSAVAQGKEAPSNCIYHTKT